MLLLSRCILCMIFSNYKVSWFLIAYFNLSLATHIPDGKTFFLGTFGAPLKKQQYCEASSIYQFQSRKCLESCLLIFIWHKLPKFHVQNLFVLEFWVLRESGIHIFLFVEHPVYGQVRQKGWGGARPPPSPPQIFAKVDLLPIDSYSEKKKMTSKIQTASNSSKTTGNITLVHSMSCRKLIFIDILSFILYLFYLLPWHFYLLPIPLR